MTESPEGHRALPPPRREPAPSGATGRIPARTATALRALLRIGRGTPEGTAELLALGAVGMALAAGYSRGDARVSLTVDGRYREITTRAPTVADLLVREDVPVGPQDIVMPDASTHLSNGTHVWIQRAREAEVSVDGNIIRLRSHGKSAEDLLASVGVTLGTLDRVHVNGEAWPQAAPSRPPRLLDRAVASIGAFALPSTLALAAEQNAGGFPGGHAGLLPGTDSTWTLEVFRALPIILVEGGVPHRLIVAGETVAEALRAAGVPVYGQDAISPAHDAPLEPDMRVTLTRATPYFLDADGHQREERAIAANIGEALASSGVNLAGRDYSIPGTEQPLVPGVEVRVIRVAEDISIEQVPIAYGTETFADPAMNLDETRVDRPGSPGLMTVKTRIVYENGVETDREILEEVVDVAPVPEIIAYGTNVVWGSVDTSEGPRQYWRKLRVYATSYSASRAGTPKSAPWYGRTRLGWTMRKGVVSVDPNVIPMSTYMYVEGYGIGQAGDTGGGVKRYHIDLGYDDDNYESWHQYVDVYLLEPLPPDRDMTWILP